jgi:hypothetical protein
MTLRMVRGEGEGRRGRAAGAFSLSSGFGEPDLFDSLSSWSVTMIWSLESSDSWKKLDLDLETGIGRPKAGGHGGNR